MKKIITAFLVLVLTAQLFVAASAQSGMDFTLPEGFRLSDEITEKESTIICGGQRVGGFILTELPAEPKEEDVLDYLRQYLKDGEVFDYMMGMPGNGRKPIDVSFIMVNLEQGTHREILHYFFCREERWYDLWLDTRYLSGWDVHRILLTSGADPEAEYAVLNNPEEPEREFGLPEGFTFAEPEGNSRAILSGGQPIGAIAKTGINPAMMTQTEAPDEDDTGFAYFSPAEFAVMRYLDTMTEIPGDYEFLLMFAEEDDGSPMMLISLQLTDTATGEKIRSSHSLFVRDNDVFDLWLDEDHANLKTAFFAAVGID